jgi:hypothetical protein
VLLLLLCMAWRVVVRAEGQVHDIDDDDDVL